MLTHLLLIVLLAIAVTMANPAWPYDVAMVHGNEKLFAPVKGAQPGKVMHLVKPDAFVNSILEEKPLVVLDIRTSAEAGVFSATLPVTLVMLS
jgi:hypothetical protein